MKRNLLSKLGGVVRGGSGRSSDLNPGTVVHRDAISGRYVVKVRTRSSALEALRSKNLLEQQVASLDRAE
ncbi:MAG: hypothetical protein JWN34_5098 [Bryobacterales bacterium]|nr:hypothetical protein [Bryobacterales bacterium]